MDNNEKARNKSYAPRSPDLSALDNLANESYQPSSTAYPPRSYLQSSDHNQHLRESFVLPPAASYGWQQASSTNSSHPPPSHLGLQQSLGGEAAFAASSYAQPYAQESLGSAPTFGAWSSQQPNQGFASQHSMTSKASMSDKLAPGEMEDIVVRTKFPVARIKRLVQADEDVGKVAQVTPVVVSKALELFMISLALKSAEEARSRNSKRVTGFHLKEAVNKDEQFDFLSEIVSKIPDAPAPKEKETKSSKHKEDSNEDDDSMEYEEKKPLRKKRGMATRKRRNEREDA